jgi:hypothetical protein
MAKVKQDSRKISFGKRKRGKANKCFNKHNSKSTYHSNNAKRNG